VFTDWRKLKAHYSKAKWYHTWTAHHPSSHRASIKTCPSSAPKERSNTNNSNQPPHPHNLHARPRARGIRVGGRARRVRGRSLALPRRVRRLLSTTSDGHVVAVVVRPRERRGGRDKSGGLVNRPAHRRSADGRGGALQVAVLQHRGRDVGAGGPGGRGGGDAVRGGSGGDGDFLSAMLVWCLE
jgi:hypothetical protein